jgi:integrase
MTPRLTDAVPQKSLADLLDAYERDYLPLKAPKTQYTQGLLFRWFRDELGRYLLTDLSPLVLRSWFDSYRPQYQPNTMRRYMTALSAVLTAGVEKYEWLPRNPLRKVPRPPEPRDRERCLTDDEQQRLLRACQRSRNVQLYPAVVLLLCTGTRKNELLQRQWRDIDVERGLLSLPQTKNKERRAIPLVPQALALLREQATYARREHPTSPWVFPRADGKKPTYIDYAWRNACARAQIEDLHLHDLRHTTASYLAMSGASLREIAEILGHRSLRQTMKYAHLLEPHTRGVLNRMADKSLAPPSAAGGTPHREEPPAPATE